MACQEREPGWYRDPEQLQAEYAAHGTFAEIAAKHGGCDTTYIKWWKRHKLPALERGPKPMQDGQELSLDADRLDDIDKLLRERGLDPAEWVVIRCVVNTWDSVADGVPLPLRQLKVTLRPRLDMLLRPADTVKAVTYRAKPRKTAKAPRLVVFVGDEQAPYHDASLHALFCEWLAHNKPDEAVHLGDLMDLPTLSRHRPNPVWNASPQECIQAGYEILHCYRESSPGTRWRALPGNHCERIRDYQIQRAPELFGVRPADLDDAERAASVQSVPTLLRFRELGIEWAGGDGDYEHAQIDISPMLIARHGFVTGGNSAEKTVKRLGINVVVGHTHRQKITYVTEDRMRQRFTIVCVEAGAMCKVEGGLGYAVNPDWAQGFATATVWPDGTFTLDHATYRDGALTWRDQRYEVKR